MPSDPVVARKSATPLDEVIHRESLPIKLLIMRSVVGQFHPGASWTACPARAPLVGQTPSGSRRRSASKARTLPWGDDTALAEVRFVSSPARNQSFR